MSAIPVASFTKMGDIYVPYCDTSRDLFPLNADASTWSSCDDAYEYTWSLDRGKDLIALTTVDRLKLSRSMGFCPHNRCQLTNLTSTANDGRCPDNLCYTKLENGAKSFGACCFIDGAFNSGQLIGYYNKTQQTPKPMYKKSRVILGDITGGPDESFRGFINANEIHNKLIATQCPLDNTVLDVARMLVEQNVSLWIQLAPFVDIVDTDKDSTHVSQCTITPEKFLNASQHLLRSGNYGSGNYIQDVSLQSTDSNQFKNPSFSARCFDIRYQAPSSEALTTDNQYHLMEEHPMDTSISALDEIQTHRLTNMWYSNWKDFAVPAASDEQDIMTMVDEAVRVMTQGGTVVVSCLSGRGRSGTLSALILGRLHVIATHSELVDIIVGMRERRDGMLETPQQFRFVAKLLQLPDPGVCGLYCAASKSVHATSETHKLLFALLAGGLLVLVPVLFMLRKVRI